jgi:hypothetical protein
MHLPAEQDENEPPAPAKKSLLHCHKDSGGRKSRLPTTGSTRQGRAGTLRRKTAGSSEEIVAPLPQGQWRQEESTANHGLHAAGTRRDFTAEDRRLHHRQWRQ